MSREQQTEQRINFTKMHGCGNDYIYIDCFDQTVADPAALSIRLSKPHFGIGADGIILIEPSERADAAMRIFNQDGSEGKCAATASAVWENTCTTADVSPKKHLR